MVRLADGMKRDPAHLYISRDNGATWQPTPALPPPLAAQPVDRITPGGSPWMRLAMRWSGSAMRANYGIPPIWA
jgi:hypothetical protein